ncbi:MAG: translocation/assembly module TamB [Chitinophagaceae bacterium]|nr:MAG: translocation/assembly module TamB [Chitinophagaceae bacterium]
MITGGKNIFADSALLVAFVRNDSTIANLVSSLADVNVASNLNYEHMPVLLTQVMSNYLSAHNNKPVPQAPPGTIVADMRIKENDLYATFVDDLSFVNVLANVAVTNQDPDSAVKGNITAEKLQVGTNKITNVLANINGTSDSLLLVVNADTVASGNVLLYDALVKAGFDDNNISGSLLTKDNNKTDQFALGFTANQNAATKGYDVSLSDALLLNYQGWQVNPNNLVRTAPAGINVQDFDISNRQQRISLSSNGTAFNAPVTVQIDDFKLSTITAALNQDSMLVEGLLNADMVVSDFKNTIPTVDGTLKVDSIQYQQASVGNLDLKASSSNGNVTVSGKLYGNGNNVDLFGNYNASVIDVKLNLNPLTLASIEPFTYRNLERSSGSISGPINLTGSVSDPRWSGELTFNQVQTTIAQFGTFVKIDGEKVTLQYPVATLNQFTIKDSTNNELLLNGTITQNQRKEFVSDLSVKTANFNVINNTAADNPMIYGKATVAVDALIEGTLTAPELTGNVTVKNGTEVTYVKQTIPTSLKERDKLIEFVDMDTISNLLTSNTAYEQELERTKQSSTASLLQYNIDLEVEEEAKFNVILDPATRDELQVQGDAQITVASNPNGAITLAGNYNLKGGSYQLNYGPVKRRFLLQEGSTVSLSGDPMNATANITAIYEINTAPLDLIGNEIGGATATQAQLYKRKIPFEVRLKITGTVSKPELGFDIVIKKRAAGVSYELSTAVENKLDQLRNDPSAMNKQVFALLALGRFVGDESSNFFGSNGTSNSSLLANESVSGFLNAAVEQLAQNLIKGVDVDINLKTVDDDPAAQRTDLNVALGKTFLDDRLSVSFGKNFTVDGADPSATNGANSGNSQFMPDVNTTYKLSRDGKYMLRAYRRNQYEAIMDGYFIETGLAFSFTMDYDKFKELFRRKKK